MEPKLNASINVAKVLYGLIKQHKIRIDNLENNSSDCFINDWVSCLFESLLLASRSQNDFTLLNELSKNWATTNVGISKYSQSTIEATLNLLQINSKFVIFMLQICFDFESINKNFDSMTDPDPTFSITLGKMENRVKRVEYTCGKLSSIIELTTKLIEIYYRLIIAFSTNSNKDIREEISVVNSVHSRFEIKQTVQIYITLIEILSTLFFKIKSNNILNELIIRFSNSLEQLSELGLKKIK